MREFPKKRAGENLADWTMFSTSKEEIHEMLVGVGSISIEPDCILFKNYPFQPSIAHCDKSIKAQDIIDIDLKAWPPTLRIGEELIFLHANSREQLASFAATNHIPVVERVDIWDWILAPFLDTEFTEETHQRLTGLLDSYGLSEATVSLLREEVRVQMLKYNFDTMIWEWGGLGAFDVLSAMRTRYNNEQFAEFHKRVMRIALLSKI